MCVELGDSLEIRWFGVVLCPHCLHFEGGSNVRCLHDAESGQHNYRECNKTIVNAEVPVKFYSDEQTGSEKHRSDRE